MVLDAEEGVEAKQREMVVVGAAWMAQLGDRWERQWVRNSRRGEGVELGDRPRDGVCAGRRS